MNNEELWKAVLGELELSISKGEFNTWFKNTSIVSNQDGRVVIGVPSGFAREWLENKVNMHILQSLRHLQSDISEFSCVINAPEQKAAQGQQFTQTQTGFSSVQGVSLQQQSSSQPPPTYPPGASVPYYPPQAHPLQAMPKAKQEHALNPRYTFENFIVGENNELARAACYAVSQNLGQLYNPIFIYGGVGLGKTHLLQSVGNEVLRQQPNIRIKYTTADWFTGELVESIRNQKVAEFKEAYQKADLLIIDDIQFLSGREKTQDEFFHIFNTLYQANKQIVLSSDRPPQAIPTLEDRLRSRFQGGMIADIGRPDLETRMAILKIKTAERHFYLDDEAVRFIAENVTNNIRELEGALNRIIASCEFHKITPTISYIKKTLGNIIANTKRVVSPERIMKMTAEFYNIEEDDLTRKGRKKEVVHPRQVGMYLMRSELQTSFAAIGKYFGGRDHTTVLHACEKIKEDLDENLRLKEEITSLKEKLYRE
ncbi:MAG: chromosomal replication initiator protein DnaA [Candidatus Moranbacteria bacterium]|nr:chromosomal replication initiator protein DnaA [Candidatus Moranbacteria bacterium]